MAGVYQDIDESRIVLAVPSRHRVPVELVGAVLDAEFPLRRCVASIDTWKIQCELLWRNSTATRSLPLLALALLPPMFFSLSTKITFEPPRSASTVALRPKQIIYDSEF